jgi:hypothetical protein
MRKRAFVTNIHRVDEFHIRAQRFCNTRDNPEAFSTSSEKSIGQMTFSG